ncbi:squalene/phytoene synthase family protein [Streptomyces sp. NRRL S-340]|uniref:squalene/phytoene synthase family protein n=1 Tax=Streptomyces sp. NRRL S-340 TaxID=1463901 RepID=UPI00099B45A0|nr:squalene/phytoene synthase family protein [Streptomyces sp. NRRL S-340]
MPSVLDRGCLYLPQDFLKAHGVDRSLLEWSRRTGHRDYRITAAGKSFAGLADTAYRDAASSTAVLAPHVRPALHAALAHYAAVLKEITEKRLRRPPPARPSAPVRRAALAVTCVARVIAVRATTS